MDALVWLILGVAGLVTLLAGAGLLAVVMKAQQHDPGIE